MFLECEMWAAPSPGLSTSGPGASGKGVLMSRFIHSTTVVDLVVDRGTLLEDIRPIVAAVARRFYSRVSFCLSGFDQDDLAQEGLIGAWQATLRVDPAYSYEQARAFCIRAAWGAIIDTIRREDRSKAGSLEAYLAPHDGDDGPGRELADRPGNQVISSLALRRSVLGMLRSCLTEKQMQAVMAAFCIDAPKTGRGLMQDQVVERLGISKKGYYSLRDRALSRLRARFGQPGNRLSGERVKA